MVMLLLVAGCSSDAPAGFPVGGLDEAGEPVDTAGEGRVDTAGEPPAESALEFTGPRPVNVLMISWDTTRPDRLGRFDPEGGAETDTIGALFDGGVVLEDHRSCSNWTWPSTICVQTGQYDFEIGWVPTSEPEYQVPVPDDFVMAGEVLEASGYQTAMVSTNAWFSENHNMTQGVQHTEHDNSAPAEWVVDSALAFFEGGTIDTGAPWYLHAHFMDAHIPFTPPDDYREALDALEEIPYDLTVKGGYKELEADWPSLDEEARALAMAHVEARYRGELASADDQVARLLSTLESMGELEETLVVFWTDHGEQFLEHEGLGHGRMLYEAENRAIAAFWASNLTPMRWEGPTPHADIWPTVLAALDVPPPESWTGLPLGSRPDDSPRFAMRHDGENDRIVQFVERSGVKLIYTWDDNKELYRLGQDPLEQENLYDPEDPEVIALWELLMPVVEATVAARPDWAPTDAGP
jgi:arylsulfatase A-like enzyme